MFKFFKAFQANPRLDIVVKTLQTAAPDLAHFAVVFMVLLVAFASTAHLIFGMAIAEFRTQFRAIWQCWVILMGDFDLEGMRTAVYTTSFFYEFWADFWFFAFTFIVLCVLLNMLLAIVMDTYSSVVGNCEGAMTFVQQLKAEVKAVKETRGHLDLWYLICEFEDDDEPAHKGPIITTKSLRKAFESDKMTKKQCRVPRHKGPEVRPGEGRGAGTETVRCRSHCRPNANTSQED
jgi:hypothetical protein